MSQSEVTEKFDQTFAKKYEDKVRATVPGYDKVHEMALSFMQRGVDSRAHILVAGAGCGMELFTMGTARLGWTFVGVDPAEKMLEIATHRVEISGLSKRVVLRQGLVSTLPPEPVFDGATSILVMHFLDDYEGKAAFLRDLAKQLRPGSPLVLVDLYGNPGSKEFSRLYSAWKNYLSHNEYDHTGLDNEMEMIHFVPDIRIRQLFHEAGFTDVSQFYGAYLFGGWVAPRNAETPA